MAEPHRVLLVDDDWAYCRMMRQKLADQGFEVEVATTGPEAIDRAQSCDGNFEVALIDLVMGPPNGIEVMQYLHQLYPTISVIILTAWGDMEPGKHAMELGAFRYMSKTAMNTSAEELALNIQIAALASHERRRSMLQEALVRAGQRISEAQTEGDLYECLLAEAKHVLPHLEGFVISRYDDHDHVVSFPFYYMKGERLSWADRQNGKGISEYVIQHQQPLLLAEGDKVFRLEHNLAPLATENDYSRSKIAVPMFLHGSVVGTIAALTFQQGTRFTQTHLEALQAFANQSCNGLAERATTRRSAKTAARCDPPG